MFSGVWSENAALFERLMKIHSNPPILYYNHGFNGTFGSLAMNHFLFLPFLLQARVRQMNSHVMLGSAFPVPGSVTTITTAQVVKTKQTAVITIIELKGAV